MKKLLFLLLLGVNSACYAEGNGVGSGGKPPPVKRGNGYALYDDVAPLCNADAGIVASNRCRGRRDHRNYRTCCFMECDRICADNNPFENDFNRQCLRKCLQRSTRR